MLRNRVLEPTASPNTSTSSQEPQYPQKSSSHLRSREAAIPMSQVPLGADVEDEDYDSSGGHRQQSQNEEGHDDGGDMMDEEDMLENTIPNSQEYQRISARRLSRSKSQMQSGQLSVERGEGRPSHRGVPDLDPDATLAEASLPSESDGDGGWTTSNVESSRRSHGSRIKRRKTEEQQSEPEDSDASTAKVNERKKPSARKSQVLDSGDQEADAGSMDVDEPRPSSVPGKRRRSNDEKTPIQKTGAARKSNTRGSSDVEDEEEDDNDEETSPVSKRQRVQNNAGAKVYDAEAIKRMPDDVGTIEDIELVDFMCHNFLRVSLCSKINFIIGHNGSGKSAILTALTVALGGKASFTNRGSSAKSMIREGAGKAQVTVKLRNRGGEAYEPGRYGHTIIVERTISKEGSTSYILKNQHGKKVSGKKQDLNAILDHMNICIDNPLAILTQDTSRQFLANSTPKDKYQFFLKGTLLKQLSDDHALIQESIRRASSTIMLKQQALPEMKKVLEQLKAVWKEIERSEQLEDKIKKFKGKYAWAFVKQYEEAHDASKELVDEISEKIISNQRRLEEAELAVAGKKEEVAQLVEQEKALKESAGEYLGRKSNLKEERGAKNKECLTLQSEVKRLETSIRTAQKNCSELEKRVVSELAKQAENKLEIRKGILDEINGLEAAISEREREFTETQKRLDELVPQISNIQQCLSSKDSERRKLENDLDGARRNLSNIADRRNHNPLANFPRNTDRLLKMIDDAERRGQWRSQKPLGPIGLYCKIKDTRYRNTIEMVLGNNLDAFIVTSSDDQLKLISMAQDCQCNVPIFKSDGRNFDFRQGEPDQHLLTILRCLEISEPIVVRQLVLHSAMEKIVLVETRNEADSIVDRQINQRERANIVAVWTASGISISASRNFAKTANATRMNEQRQARIQTDNSALIREYQQRIDILDADYKHVVSQLREIKIDNDRSNNEKHRLTAILNKSMSDAQRFKNLVSNKKDELKEEEPTNVAALQGYVEEARNEISLYTSQREGIINQLSAAREELNALDTQLQSLQDEMNNKEQVVHKKITARENKVRELKNAETSVDHHKRKQVDYQARADDAQRELDQLKKKWDEERAKALEYTNGEEMALGENDKPERLKKKIDEYEAALRKNREKTGSKEEVHAKLVQKKAEYDAAQSECNMMEKVIRQLHHGLQHRVAHWAQMRQMISVMAKNTFTKMMEIRGFTASIILDHEKQMLEIRVDVHNTGDVRNDKDPKTLSGGEKSFSTVCLLLSLWDYIGNPFRALDEFDVFMDAVNRRVSMKLMIDDARKADAKTHQFIFITPQDMSHVPGLGGPDVKVNRLQDPERNQGRLNFQRLPDADDE